jgi:hypothetical protein
MSDTGLFTGLYSRVKGYAELLDCVILDLKAGKSRASDPGRKRLSKLLQSISGNQVKADFGARLFSVLVQEQPSVSHGINWSTIGAALESDIVPSSVVEELEKLAGAIDQERAGLLSKMRGSTR